MSGTNRALVQIALIVATVVCLVTDQGGWSTFFGVLLVLSAL